jgi:hypothetical protein
MPEYGDLEISLRRKDEQSYAAELRYNAPNSETDQRLIAGEGGTLPIDPVALRALEPDWKGYGAALSAALFAGDVSQAFREVRLNAQSQSAILRVRLNIENSAAELHNVHWESVHDPERPGVPLFASEQVVFSRYLSSMDWRPVRSRPRTDLKALIAIANPSNIGRYGPAERPFAPIDVAGEMARAEAALGTIDRTALIEPGTATIENIIGKLRDGYDILYLVCHGALIEREPGLWDPRLFLESADGAVKTASGAELVRLIQDLPERPRLVVLASCQSAGTGAEVLEVDPRAMSFAVGPQLAEAGIPAVLAMRGNITMATVDRFMPVFFTELGRDGQIDRAMAVARHAVRDRQDFWMPVLYLRLRSGRIWYVPGFGENKSFELWDSICGFVASGEFVPILGPELAEPVFGGTRDIADDLANDSGFPMSAWERSDPAKVAQFVATKASPATLRREMRGVWFRNACKRFPALVEPGAPPLVVLDRIVTHLLEQEDHPYRILAELDQAPVYVTANADSLLEMALKKKGRVPSELVCKWRDERLETAGAPESKAAPPELDPKNPLLFYVYGKSQLEDTWVLTEDDFFDYLIRTSKHKLMPWSVRYKLITSSLMFLGFPLDDWKFRILFRMILDYGGSSLLENANHVGVQVNPDETTLADAVRAKRYLERYFRNAKIDIYWGTAADFLKELQQQLRRYEREKPEAVAASSAAW